MKEIPLTNGGVALVDDRDFERVNLLSWRYMIGNSTRYATTNFWSFGKNYLIYMHRWIMKPPLGLVVDHINGKGLDNTRANLRILTDAENKLYNYKRR